MSILDEILKDKRKEVAAAKKAVPLSVMKKAALRLPAKKFGFQKALASKKYFAVIAEIKKKSPSKGLLCRHFDPVRIARQYAKGGAAALSVLTDKKYFGGSVSFIPRVKRAVSIPVLRKDFVIDEYQIYETRLLNADALLLIARALSAGKMRSLYGTARRLGLDVLFEVHNESELKKVLDLKPAIVGVNNRDLGTFKVDLGLSGKLSGRIPQRTFFVSESGIHSSADLDRVRMFGADAALVGESLMRQKDPGKALHRLLGGMRGSR